MAAHAVCFAPTRYSPGPLDLFLISCIVSLAACHSPLRTNKDAGDAGRAPDAPHREASGDLQAPGDLAPDGTAASDLAADALAGPDATAPVDAGSEPEAAGCQPLTHTNLGPLTGPAYCPVDRTLPACASSDLGARVYRDEACALATLAAHPDCAPWSRGLDVEYVILTDPFGGCDWPIGLESVLDCGDHVAITYAVEEPCQTCDAVHPSSVVLMLPVDRKPVRAIAVLVHQKC